MGDLQNSAEILPLVQPKFGDDKRSISLSALQHYAFCPRQCALIHNETGVGRKLSHRTRSSVARAGR